MDQNNKPGSGRAVLRGVIAAYLIYLGGSLISGWVKGTSNLKPALVWTCGPLFVIGGLLFGLWTWRQWKADQTETDRPDTPAVRPESPSREERPEE